MNGSDQLGLAAGGDVQLVAQLGSATRQGACGEQRQTCCGGVLQKGRGGGHSLREGRGNRRGVLVTTLRQAGLVCRAWALAELSQTQQKCVHNSRLLKDACA